MPPPTFLASVATTGAVTLAEQLTRLGVTALAFLLILALMRGWLVTALRHRDAVESMERLLAEKDEQIGLLAEDRDWWKDATVTALQIGETVAGRGTEGR